jgi:GNAT superfamily N-acetyltransferase
MFKYLENDTWGYLKEDEILVQAKIWFYPQLPVGHSLYKVGLIGEFKCEEKTSLNESKAFLDKLVSELKGLGAAKVVGPMNGNTWQPYRLTTYYGEHKPFLLEPYTPAHFVAHWENAGFIPEETYSSYITTINEWEDKRIDKLHNRFKDLVFKDLETDDLGPIFDLSIQSFMRNPYYIHIDKEVYLQKYGNMMSLLKPNVSWVVYDGEELVGYLFAMLDMSQQARGEKINRVILKTVAVKEDRKYAGLGTYLLSKSVEQMKSMGIEYAIHALMYDKNAVQNIIKDNSEKLRGYTLYKRGIK